MPCDVNGDGRICDSLIVAGRETGIERFNPEWLFRMPGKIEGRILNVRGQSVISAALTNVREAYALDSPLLADRDADTFPDAIDPKPEQPGFRDGER